MTKSTKFYLPFFKTGYPFGKLWTYKTDTYEEAITYSDTIGTQHTNPIILDEKGNCILYIDKDTTYRYRLQDQNGNIIYEIDNIKQLNGEKGPSGGSKGPDGEKGKIGDQGIGIRGPDGFSGPVGQKGQKYLTSINISNNQSIIIPKGNKEFYVTGTGAGGASASYSAYYLMSDVRNTSQTNYITQASFKIKATGVIREANVGTIYPFRKFRAYVFLPGTGFSGQSVYRKKITLNEKIDNTIKVFCGTGGIASNISLNGNNGTDTLIYVNDQLVLTLKGGIGGKNIFPFSDVNQPILPVDGTPIRLNQGFNNGLIVMQQNSNTQLDVTLSNQKDFIYETTYKQNNGGGFTNVPILVTLYAPNLYVNSSNALSNKYTTSSTKELTGESNLFSSYYSYYQVKSNESLITSGQMLTSRKSGNNKNGWGAGGDSYYNFISNPQNSQFATNLDTIFRKFENTPSDITFFDKTYAKYRFIDYLKNFSASDSYSNSTSSTPSINDTSGVWSLLDELDLKYNTTQIKSRYSGTKFYKFDNIVKVMTAQTSQAVGGSGVDGFVNIEYGFIEEILPV